MAIQLSVAARNARLDAIETTAGTSAVLQIRTSTPPADCAAANTGSLLVTLNLPSNWMNDAASGQKTLAGSWTASASGTGTAGHFRIFNNGVTTCHIQGTITATGGGGDMTLDNVSINSGQTVTVNSFTLTDASA